MTLEREKEVVVFERALEMGVFMAWREKAWAFF
jgi:hypothetical protein